MPNRSEHDYRTDLREALADQLTRCEADLLDELSATLLELHQQASRDASEALERLAAGTYGYCADCHVPIPVERLAARALTIRCDICERTWDPERTPEADELELLSRLRACRVDN
jgi:RNA polymerase-binding transcription factor DksA